ncbi:MAG: glutathione S-transferase family protein [Myxococcales bacterium]
MSDELLFYHNPFSRGRIVQWMLEEVGAPYRVELVRLDQREQKRPEYLAVNPMGKIPTIVHRGVVITEAAAICTYLADAFPETKLAPALTDPARGTYLRWLFFGAGCIEPALADKLLERPAPAPERSSALGYGSYENVLATLEKAVSPGPHILGDAFSAADVYVGSAIGFGLGSKAIEPRPAFMSYLAKLSERPAYKRANAKNEAFAAELKAKS